MEFQMKQFITRTLLLLVFPVSLHANEIKVEGLQAPAWYERDGVRQALAADTILMEKDLVQTGDSGKLWLKMNDGAIVKLGNQAKMKVKSISAEEDATTGQLTLNAGIKIAEGAFRYTTSKLNEYLSQNWQRDVEIELATTAAIGIRGTDLWGKVGGDTQFVVLLEGNINVTPSADGSTPVILDQPLQIFKVENGQPVPVSTVDMDAVKALAPETELDFGEGVQQSDATYKLNLASTQNENAAKRLVKSLKEKGYSAKKKEVEVNGEAWIRISMGNFVSVEDAKTLGEGLTDDVNVVSPWVQ